MDTLEDEEGDDDRGEMWRGTASHEAIGEAKKWHGQDAMATEVCGGMWKDAEMSGLLWR